MAEWGNPIESEEEYRWIAAYSPYDNVEKKPYPPIIALSGLTDPRVTYWEPTKWIAKLRDTAPEAGPFLLKTIHGRRPWRQVGALPASGRDRVRICLRDQGGGEDVRAED